MRLVVVRRRYPLDAVVAHVAACPACAALLDVSARTRDHADRAAFATSLARDLDRGTAQHDESVASDPP